jgi:hypothetical protein
MDEFPGDPMCSGIFTVDLESSCASRPIERAAPQVVISGPIDLTVEPFQQ